MTSPLPAPYEAVERDDLTASVSAALAVSGAGITAWVLGHWSYRAIDALVRLERTADWHLEPPTEVLVPAAGWALGALLLAIGALLLLFRAGRGVILWGAVIAGATTVVAAASYGYGGAAAKVTVDQWALYWGGLVVFVLAVLPATGRWARRTARVDPSRPPGISGPGLAPGL